MTTTKKIILTFITLIFVMLLIPLLVVWLASPDLGMSLILLLFFVINPLTVIALGVMAGSNVRKLWWIPLVAAAIFPLFFGVAIREIVAELFLYSAIYLCVSTVAMMGRHVAVRHGKKQAAQITNQEQS